MTDDRSPTPADPPAVLLVDDRPANLLALEVVLAGTGLNLVRATSGEAALRLLAGRDFAAVLLDLNMPGLDGFETARRVRADERARDTPILFVTAEDDRFPVVEAYNLGAVDYLVKPLVPEIVRAKVGVFAELYRRAERVRRLEQERGRAAVRDREGLLSTLGDNLPAGFIYRVQPTPDGGRRFTYLSAGVERLFGVPVAEALADAGAIYRLIHPDDAPGVAAAEAEALAGTAIFDWEFRVRTRTGPEVWVHCRSAPERLVDGSVVWDGLLTDATARKRAEDELRQKEAELTDFVENATVGLHWVGPDGTILWANRAELDLLGYTQKEYVGRNIAEFHADPAVIIDILCRLTSGEELQGYEARLRCKDGSVRHVLISSNVYREGGRFVHTRCFTRDITERKRAEDARREGEARSKAIIETALDCVVGMDHEGRITEFNPAAEATFGYRREEVLGREMCEFIIPPELCDPHRAGLRRYLATGEARVLGRRVELTAVRKGGGRFLCELAITRNPGDPPTFTGFIRDITERKAAEAALREADRRKDEFLAMLAHELRNPLAPIGNAMHLMARSRDEAILARVHEMVTRQVGHLSRIVDDLLEVSRVARGKVELRRERLDLGRVVRQAGEDQAGAFDRAGVRLDVGVPETPVWVDGDRTRLAQVVTNLLANAAKFTDRGGVVAVRLAPEAGQAELTVADTGIGVDPEVLPRLFEPFAQADRTLARSNGGLGLGLALVKGFVEMHGGTVAAASPGPGLGSEFTVRLATVPEPPALTAARPPARPAQTVPKRVLIVEDNRDAADSLKLVFELTGYEVTVAYTGPEGAEAARRVKPDLVICDIGLPGMDGYAVARRIRADLGAGCPVLVALTGYGEAADRDKALAAGFDRHFTKPADPLALEAALTARA